MKRLVDWVRVNGYDILINCLFLGFVSFLFKVSATEGQWVKALSIHIVEVLFLTALVSFTILYSLHTLFGIFRASNPLKAEMPSETTSKSVKYLSSFGRFLLISLVYNFLNVLPDTDPQGVVAIMILYTFFFVLGAGAYHQYNKEISKQATV